MVMVRLRPAGAEGAPGTRQLLWGVKHAGVRASGAKARIGPAQLGCVLNFDVWGLRGGALGEIRWLECTWDFLYPWRGKRGFGEDRFLQWDQGPGARTLERRGKAYYAKAPVPLIGIADEPEYYTQIEVLVGLIGSLRLGFNPGEMLDFVLGWADVDIYADDLKEELVRRPEDSTVRAAPAGPRG